MAWQSITKAYVFAAESEHPVPVAVVDLQQNVYRFLYAPSWLMRPDAFALDPLHLPLSEKVMTAPHLFGVLSDSTPDTWGRRVMAAIHTQSPASELEWLIASRGRGAGCLLASASANAVLPPVSLPTFDQLSEVILALDRVQAREVLDPGLIKLLDFGSSMGGARPKSTLQMDGAEWIAKLGRPDDLFDYPRAEYASLMMAKAAGIRVPDCRLIEIHDRSVVLVKRFDREQNLKRHYLSAHALLGFTRVRPDDTRRDYSYVGIAAALGRISGQAQEDRIELFRRMIFNVCIGNTDDHLRNHGLLLDKQRQFCLSPAFDMLPNPQQTTEHAIGIGRFGRQSSFDNALSRSDAFGINQHDAIAIIDEVQSVVAECGRFFSDAGLKGSDRRMLEQVCQRHPQL